MFRWAGVPSSSTGKLPVMMLVRSSSVSQESHCHPISIYTTWMWWSQEPWSWESPSDPFQPHTIFVLWYIENLGGIITIIIQSVSMMQHPTYDKTPCLTCICNFSALNHTRYDDVRWASFKLRKVKGHYTRFRGYKARQWCSVGDFIWREVFYGKLSKTQV